MDLTSNRHELRSVSVRQTTFALIPGSQTLEFSLTTRENRQDRLDLPSPSAWYAREHCRFGFLTKGRCSRDAGLCF